MKNMLLFTVFAILSCNSNNTNTKIYNEQNASNLRRDSLFEPLSKQVLSNFLIDSILNFKLTKKEEESTSGYGYKVNTILGFYSNNDDSKKVFKLYLSDAGGAKSILGVGAWASLDFNKTNEFTKNINGKKYYMKLNNKNKKGEMDVLINNRFVVQLKSKNVDSTDMYSIINDLISRNQVYFENARQPM